ncbi:type I-E CRISPR-associated protein Cse2/CasB [Azohydromonas australica]|uniref:type I-E CRISPR-associated protein Cse2/CasB n=1 Tax=Azohydromonas australica TaxID=364039 RepID=UPI0004228F86|nr:type I-E CRISPR-associated protein Cse2/CasB [Azohydromonas australica]
MSSFNEDFIKHLETLKEHDRGAIAALRRSLSFAPGSYVPAFQSIERFSARNDDTPWRRQALYLTAGLYALHPEHAAGQSLAAVLARVMLDRKSPSIEKRFLALLATEPEELPDHLRQVVSLLAATKAGIDYVELFANLSTWLEPRAFEDRDRLRQRWAKAFYRAAAPAEKPAEPATAQQD